MTFPKPSRTRKQERAIARRREAEVKTTVRAQVSQRDAARTLSGCRYPHATCDGGLEWAHVWDTRARTRNQPPGVRHRTDNTLMLCRVAHHAFVDANLVDIVAVDPALGTDSALLFVDRVGGYVIGLT